MFKWLLIIGLVVLGLAVGGLVVGLTSQQPLAFAAAILCLFPLAMYFLGGATFNFVANYQISPRVVQDAPRASGISRLARKDIG